MSSVVEPADRLQQALRDRDVLTLCRAYFAAKPTKGQCRIIESIVFRGDPRVAIRAPTQYGKTWTVALALALCIILWPGLQIGIVSPTNRQSRKLRIYFVDLVRICPELRRLIDLGKLSQIERLRKEVSAVRMTFRDGTDMQFFSCEGTAQRLMGEGSFDLLLEDESGLITDDVHQKRIRRMLSKKGCVHVKLGNPWEKNHHFHRAVTSGQYVDIHITWHDAVEEGRFTQSFVDQERRDLPPMVFCVLYEAEFPDISQDAVIQVPWIDEAFDKGLTIKSLPNGRRTAGLDVAEGGQDRSAVVRWIHTAELRIIFEVHAWHEEDTTKTADRTARLITKDEPVRVDTNGVGKGPADQLRRKGYKVSGFKAGRSAEDSERFVNRASEVIWTMRNDFMEGNVAIMPLPDHLARQLRRDLAAYRYTMQNGRIAVVKPRPDGKPRYGIKVQGPSPDVGDACSFGHGVRAMLSKPRAPKRKPLVR